MKKKGFTLVELLAVIVILAIIALITLPLITGVVEKARKGSAVSSAYGYVDAVEKYMMMHYLNSEKYPITLEKGQTYQISKKEFKTNLGLNLIENVYAEGTLYLNDFITVKGVKPSSGTVTIGNNNTVEKANIVTNSYLVECNGKKCEAKRKMVVDKTAPVVTLGEATSTKNSITINYTSNDPESGIDNVKCYYKKSTDSDYTNSVDGNNGVCEITGLNGGNNYTYKVKAINGDGLDSSEVSSIETKKICTVTRQNADTLTVGDVVTCEGDTFYYLGEEGNNAKLFAKYCLNSNSEQSSTNQVTVPFSSTNYMNGKVGNGLTYNNVDSSWYFVYDINSTQYTYMEAYATKIRNLGFSSVSARPIKMSEYWSKSYWNESGNAGGNFWTGAAGTDEKPMRCQSWDCWGTYYDESYRIRPVILIPKSEL